MPSIYSWPCSYYINDKRQWVYGQLRLYNSGLLFLKNKGEEKCSEYKKCIPFSNIVDITKAQSALVYSCIVINVKVEKLWLSSLQHRDDVFNIVEHFWREPLFTSASQGNNSNQELFQIVYNTQETLVDAAQTLRMQGQQISHASQTMNMMHNNITVAERITSDIDSWFGAWRLKCAMKKTKMLPEKTKTSVGSNNIEYPILITGKANGSHTTGYLILRKNNVDILNDKSEILFSFAMRQISEVRVHSPWNMTFIRRYIGKDDIKIHITSRKAPLLLKTLQNICKCELSFDEPPNEPDDELEEHLFYKERFDQDKEVATGIGRLNLLPYGEPTGKVIMQSRQKTISDEDASELSTVLKSIKTLAENVSVEQDAQMKQIDALTDSVDKANLRIKAADWKVNKLT